MTTEKKMTISIGDPMREAAARWHDEMSRDKVSAETRAAFTRWLEQSPQHRTAYEAVQKVWSTLQQGLHDPQLLALRHETALRITRRSAKTVRRVQWPIAAALVVCLGIVVAMAVGPRMMPRVNAMLASFGIATNGRYSTDIGERLAVNLKDGSQVTLNTNTSLQVRYTAGERHITLTQGQALFEVAKDRSRPFVVEAQGRRFVAVGTAFDVRVNGERVQVTMLEGTVRVERSSPNRADDSSSDTGAVEQQRRVITTISAGEQLTANDREQDRVRVADAERETSWRRGQLLFENTRLGDALVEVNRYSERQIRLADESLAELRISGAFSTGRPTVFVEALTTYFPIDARTDEATVLLTARP